MRLLPKSVIHTELASQKKKQIDEGLMIARKVDVLRETLTSLEQQHKEFVGGMKSELKAQTQPLIDEIAERKQIVEKLKLRREELLVPLTKEWNEVNSKRKELDGIADDMSEERKLLKKAQGILDARLKKEKDTVFKINTIRNEIQKVLTKEKENEDRSQKALKLAEVTRDKTLKECTERTQAINTRDAKVAVREREVELYKLTLDADYKFVDEEKKRLLDQRATLERAFKRLKK